MDMGYVIFKGGVPSELFETKMALELRQLVAFVLQVLANAVDVLISLETSRTNVYIIC